jgi:hypothetical protein
MKHRIRIATPLLPVLLFGWTALGGCSSHTKQSAQETAHSAGQDAKHDASHATHETGEAVEDTGEKIKEKSGEPDGEKPDDGDSN